MAIEAELIPRPSENKFIPFSKAELSEASLRLTNVFMDQPPSNNLDFWCTKKADLPKDYPNLPALTKSGGYIRPEFFPHLWRLHEELLNVRPNLIIAAGNTACWFLLATSAISRLRGYVHASPYGKVLPTFHPAAVLRAWHTRPIVVGDLLKARRQAAFPEIVRPRREVWIEPSIDDIIRFHNEHLKLAETIPFDIETERSLIKCISLGRDSSHAIVIPFIDRRKPDFLYWQSAEEHAYAINLVRAGLELPQPKVTQNGPYDVQWIWKQWGFTPVNWTKDTLLAHWSVFPEMPKSLEFMGSAHTDEAPWKFWHRTATDKVDD